MDLNAYLRRIGLEGPLAPTLETLQAVHRAQAYALPYEGLDVQLGVPLDFDLQRIFDKLVTRQRGGWCYETNGLLEWALREIGFDVRRRLSGVDRREKGDWVLGNHLLLIVRLEQDWLCDLGLGDSLRAPIPLIEGIHKDDNFEFRLEKLPDGYWRFHNHAYGAPSTFDFRDEPADEDLLLRHNTRLQTDPASYFILNAEAIMMGRDHSVTLLGRVLRVSSAHGVQKSLLNTPEELAEVLETQFGIEGVDVVAIWPRILARHEALFGE